MAEPLLSLMTPGTMKHVVPWKTRQDFLSVYEDLYSDSVKSQESAIGRILAWKSRAGNKLSVAIESSASLMQVQMQHLQAQKDGKLHLVEHQLCSNYSLALIRFVNHMTEKAQTKAVAQPVHLVAREFGIPEWIVRLRHDATHSALPCLDVLASGTKWALDYLQHNFWEQQRSSSHTDQANEDVDDSGTNGEKAERSPKTADIRRAFYEFQKIRYQRESSGDAQVVKDHTAILGKLQKFMSQNNRRFIKCFLEDGILIATEEQLEAFGFEPSDLIAISPPTIPEQIALFWHPLLKRATNAGILPSLLHTAMFLVTSERGLRNYQLVAWIAFILANTSSSESKISGRRRKNKKEECFMRTSQPVPIRILYSACIQNLNSLTVHLLRHLLDPDNVGSEVYDKLVQQLQVAPPTSQQMGDSKATDECAESADVSTSSSDSDSDNNYTLQDIKRTSVEDGECWKEHISPSTVENIKKIVGHGHTSWTICSDDVDWSTIPLGILPDQTADAAEDSVSEGSDDSNDSDTGRPGKQAKRRRRRERRGDRGKHEDDDEEDEDDEESDDADQHSSPKRSKLIVTDHLLI